MKFAALILLVLSLQAGAETHDIISCETFTNDSRQTLHIYETATGYGLTADVKPIAFSHAQPYHSESAVSREFVNGRGALHFENENELVVHGFGAFEYNTRDLNNLLYFRDHDCTLTPGTLTVPGAGQMSAGVKDCEFSEFGLLVQVAESRAEANASAQCGKVKAVRITEFEIENHCRISVADVKVSAVFRCEGMPEAP